MDYLDYFINGIAFGAGVSTGLICVLCLFVRYMQRRTTKTYGPMRICPHCREELMV